MQTSEEYLFSRVLTPFTDPPPPVSEAGARKLWRLRRNMVIYVAYRQGFSHRFIAEAFGLSSSLVRQINRKMSLFEKDKTSREVRRRHAAGGRTTVDRSRRQRLRRDELIRALASRALIPRAFLADAFDLPRSRLDVIVQRGPDEDD
jgi:hypothetical protein